MATQNKITIYRAEDIVLNFTMTPTTDITGWTLVFNVSESKNSATKLITNKACSIVSAVAGTFTASLLTSDTNIAPGEYWWDVYRTNSGSVRCVAYGPFNVQAVAKFP